MKQNAIQNVLLFLSVMMAGYACTTAPNTTKNTPQSNDKSKQVAVQNENADAKPVQQQDEQSSAMPVVEQSTPLDVVLNVQQRILEENKLANKNPNRFNRLLDDHKHSTSELHDKSKASYKFLQKPAEAFVDFPEAKTGNRVDWVKAVDSGIINPRHDLTDTNIKPMVLDMNIVMQVKGSMPDVVFPHRQHTRWLDCSNCHPAIFIPQSGANKMSMADNLLGKRCGICHGRVAFPLTSCTKCHSNKKVVVKEKK